LFGAIIVDPSSDINMPQELLTWTHVVLEFQHFATKSINTHSDPFTVRTYTDLIRLSGDKLNPNFSFINQNVQDIYYVNGQFQPIYKMQAGTNIIFDMVNAVGDHTIEIEIRSQIGGGSTACTMNLLAIDGVYLSSARQVTYVVMVQSQRASISVNCPSAGTYYLQTNADLASRPGVAATEARFNQNLVTLKVSGGSGGASSVPNLSQIKRPSYLSDLTKVTPAAKWSVSVEQPQRADVMWLGQGKTAKLIHLEELQMGRDLTQPVTKIANMFLSQVN